MTKKVKNHNVKSFVEVGNEVNHHIWLIESPQMRISTNMLFNIYSCIQRRNLTHTLHINISLLSEWLFVFVTWWDSLIRSEAQHGKKGGLVTVSKRNVFLKKNYFFHKKRETKLEKERK